MKIATARQMKNIDRRAIREFGIPGTVLMENAAAAVLDEMERFFKGLAGVRVGILCGKGNNGGDGFALARRLRIRGVPVRVALLAPLASAAGEAKVNLAILRKMDVEILPNARGKDLSDIMEWADILVDALLGTGLMSPLQGMYAQAVMMMNAGGRQVVSVDIPTGINADSGAVMGAAVRADLTVTMALPKRGLVTEPGASYAGVLRVADIGMPPEAVDRENIRVELLGSDSVRDLLRERAADTHKGDYGHLMIVAGSPGKAGAAVLAARGALRAGAGLVSVAAPLGIVPVIQQQIPEAMCIPSAESIDGTLGAGAEFELGKAAARMSACAVGPGLTQHAETVQAVRSLLQRITVPVVIDADGLNAVAGSPALLKRLKAPAVLTPHPGEMGRLLGISSAEVQADRIGLASDFAAEHRVTLVLKGAGTVIAAPSGEVFVNTTGNAGMATAGSGDVLTGMIGSLLAQGYPALQAASLGVYLHGLAGDLAAKEKGEAGLIAGDIAEKVPESVLKVTNQPRIHTDRHG